MKFALLWPLLLLAACLTTVDPDADLTFDDQDEPALKAVPYVDMTRYVGRWYLVANMPYFAEAGNVAVYVEYSPRPDGLYDDTYWARDSFDLPPFVKHGLIEITNPITNAEGRITFLQPLWQDYTVVFLDDDYRHSVIAHPSRNYCWIFSREPQVSDSAYQAALAALADNGFDVARVLKVPQRRSDLGRPGFQ